MSNNTKVVDGTVVTNTDIKPPLGWTNNYEDMGGDAQWSQYGDVPELTRGSGLDGTVNPIFAMESWTGEAMSLFELSGDHYLYNAIEGSLYKICDPTDLQTIASTIDDQDQGISALEIEAL